MTSACLKSNFTKHLAGTLSTCLGHPSSWFQLGKMRLVGNGIDSVDIARDSAQHWRSSA